MKTTTNKEPIERALAWCLNEGDGSEAARVLARILLNKHDSRKYPDCDLEEVASILDDTQRDWAIGIILYAGEEMLTHSEAEQLHQLTFNEW